MTATGEIAAVISALMNTSGGVVVVEIEGARLQTQVDLDAFQNSLSRSLTEQLNWISKSLFETYVKPKFSTESNEIFFFVNKCEHLVTLCSNAFTIGDGDIQPISEFHELCSRLSKCLCDGEKKCEHHADDNHVLQSALEDTTILTMHRPFPTARDKKCWFRHYKLHGRTLNEVLCTNSVKLDLWKLFSGVANGDGGSIFLGITDTDSPIVKGYSKTDIATVRSSIDWEYFTHPVTGSREEIAVIEICVDKFPTGYFIAIPLCFEVDEFGNVVALEDIEEWKVKMLRGYKSEPAKKDIPLEEHFLLEKVENPDGLSEPTTFDVTHEQNPAASLVSPLCLSTTDVGSGELLRFDKCCARDLADEKIDMTATFHFFLPTEVERISHDGYLGSVLRRIEEKYQGCNGVGCVIRDELSSCNSMTVDRPRHHMCDIIILMGKQRPSIISVVGNDCDQTEANHYSVALATFLKRECMLTYRELCDRTSNLSFQRHLFYIGKGLEDLEEKMPYPKEYMQPTQGTLNSVRYVLASIFLRCEPIKDRFGDILVRHLTSCQAGVLWGKWLKVNVVEGKAGSGKSILILETMRRIKHHGEGSRILYLCRGKGLAAFVQYQCQMMGICAEIETIDGEAKEHLTEKYFSEYTDIFIDDAHALPLSGEPNCRQMYDSLLASLRSPKSRLYIFLDLDMQDYRGCIPINFTKEIRTMAKKYTFLRYEIRMESLGKVLRNSHRVCQFINGNIGDEDLEEIQGIRNLPNDNVYLKVIQSLSPSSVKVQFQKEPETNAGPTISQHNDKGRNLDSDVDTDDEYDGFMEGVLDEEERRSSPDTLLTQLKEILKLPAYHERHIAILTGTVEDKILVLSVLYSARLPT